MKLLHWVQIRWLQFLAVAGVAITVRLYPLLFQSKTLIFGDNYSLMVPGKLFIAEWLKQGIMPWWNPLIFGGLSIVGDINQSLFYFSTWLFAILTPATALNVTIIIHLFIAGLGAYGLTYRLTKHQVWASLAGVLWLLSTQVSGSINNISTIQSIVWLPWLVWAGMDVPHSSWARLRFALLVLVQFLAGYPQHVLYSILLAVGLSAYLEFALRPTDGLAIQASKITTKGWLRLRAWLLVWAVTGLISVALSAVVWWPFLENLQHSTRIIQTQAQSEAGSLHPSDLIKIITPYFFDNPVAGVKWGPQWNGMSNLSLYLTWLGLVVPLWWWLTGRARRWDWLVAGMLLGTILFALGGNLPGFTQLQEILPIFRISRGPSTILMLTNLLWIVWLATILSRAENKSVGQKKLKFGVWIFSLGLVVATVTLGAWWLGQTQFQLIWTELLKLTPALAHSPFHTLARDQLIWSQIFGSLAANAALFSLAWLAWQRQWRWLVVTAVVIDMVVNTQGLFFFAPSQTYRTANELQTSSIYQVLPRDFQNRFLIRNYNSPYTDFSAYWEALAVREPFSDSFVSAQELKDFMTLQHLANGFTPDWNMVARVPAINGYTTLLPQSVNQTWVKDPALVGINNLPEIKLTQPELKTWAVRYYLVDKSFLVKEDLSGFKKVAETGPWSVYELPGTLARLRWGDTQTAISAMKWTETPNKISFWTDNLTTNPRPVVLADRFDSNWRATIDGQAIPVQNVADQRQIMVLPGAHQVVFEFVPLHLYQGALVSGLTLILAIIIVACSGVLSRNRIRLQGARIQQKKQVFFLEVALLLLCQKYLLFCLNLPTFVTKGIPREDSTKQQ